MPGQLEKLIPLADAEAAVLKQGPDGYVQLKNQNKIWGRILEDLPDVVTIQTGQLQIIVPRESVLEVSKKQAAVIQLGREEEDWSDDSIPTADLPKSRVPELEKPGEEETAAGAVRVNLGPTPSQRAAELKRKVRSRIPAIPGSKR